MGRSKVIQRIVLTLLGADVDSDIGINLAIDCAHLDPTEDDLTLVVNQPIALTNLTAGTTYYYEVRSRTTVRATLPF